MRSARRFFTDGEMRDLLRKLRQKARSGRLIDKIDHALVIFAWATGCRSSEIASASLDPRQPNRIDLQAGFVAAEEQLGPGLTIWTLVEELDGGGPVPLDVHDGNLLLWEDSFDSDARFQVFEFCHGGTLDLALRSPSWGNRHVTC